MANILYYVITAGISLMVGAGLGFLGISLYNFWITKRTQKLLKRDADGKIIKEQFDDGGPMLLDEKEVLENERTKQDSFREFEKLKHKLGGFGTGKHSIKKPDSNERRSSVQNNALANVARDQSDVELHDPTNVRS